MLEDMLVDLLEEVGRDDEDKSVLLVLNVEVLVLVRVLLRTDDEDKKVLLVFDVEVLVLILVLLTIDDEDEGTGLALHVPLVETP
jgi:hypothetical protein